MRTTQEVRLRTDRTTIRIFLVLAILLSTLVVASYVFSANKSTPDQLLGSLLTAITIAFFLSGIVSYFRNRDASLIPRRRITIWALEVSLGTALVLTALFAIAVAFISIPEVTDTSNSLAENAVIIIAIFLALIPTLFVVIFFGEVTAFGVIGVMAAIERRLAPGVLSKIIRLEDRAKLSPIDIFVKWLFAIPDIVDTKLLDVHPSPKRPFVRWRDMMPALVWELLFGGVLALYISLNPFVAGGRISVSTIFSLMTNGAVLIPFVILPWFAIQRLGAGIGGAKKEFTLYNGIRSRLLQSFFAIGTLLLIARVLISETDIENFVVGFVGFMVSLTMVSLLCTFVYLNFFENDLVQDIAAGFQQAKSGSIVDGKNG